LKLLEGKEYLLNLAGLVDIDHAVFFKEVIFD
jgi:hypothetical protein